MEATLFTGWIYDFLLPHAHSLDVAHPAMIRAIAASKKKNDRVDARKIADLLRCDLLPVCYMAPAEVRELRRLLRFRNLMVRQAVRMKNKAAGLLMEVGAEYSKEKLDQKRYFQQLLDSVEHVPESVKQMLRMSRAARDLFEESQRRLVAVSPLAEMKLAIYRSMLERRMSKAELARRLNCHMPQIDRLLDLSHHSRLDQIEAAFRAVGKRLVIGIEDVA